MSPRIGYTPAVIPPGSGAGYYVPGKNTLERACWYINMGVINKEFCTTMVQAALTAKL